MRQWVVLVVLAAVVLLLRAVAQPSVAVSATACTAGSPCTITVKVNNDSRIEFLAVDAVPAPSFPGPYMPALLFNPERWMGIEGGGGAMYYSGIPADVLNYYKPWMLGVALERLHWHMAYPPSNVVVLTFRPNYTGDYEVYVNVETQAYGWVTQYVRISVEGSDAKPRDGYVPVCYVYPCLVDLRVDYSSGTLYVTPVVLGNVGSHVSYTNKGTPLLVAIAGPIGKWKERVVRNVVPNATSAFKLNYTGDYTVIVLAGLGNKLFRVEKIRNTVGADPAPPYLSPPPPPSMKVDAPGYVLVNDYFNITLSYSLGDVGVERLFGVYNAQRPQPGWPYDQVVLYDRDAFSVPYSQLAVYTTAYGSPGYVHYWGSIVDVWGREVDVDGYVYIVGKREVLAAPGVDMLLLALLAALLLMASAAFFVLSRRGSGGQPVVFTVRWHA